MENAATTLLQSDAGTFPSWPLRLAQQAFSALLEAANGRRELEAARLRTMARDTLSILSADDRGRLQSWLNLQLSTTRNGMSVQRKALVGGLGGSPMDAGRSLAPSLMTHVMSSPSQVGIAA